MTKMQIVVLAKMREGYSVQVRPGWYTALYTQAGKYSRRVSDLTIRSLARRGLVTVEHSAGGAQVYIATEPK